MVPSAKHTKAQDSKVLITLCFGASTGKRCINSNASFCYEYIQNWFISLEFFVAECLNVKLYRRSDGGYGLIEGIPFSYNRALRPTGYAP